MILKEIKMNYKILDKNSLNNMINILMIHQKKKINFFFIQLQKRNKNKIKFQQNIGN